ncbi:MAG TPA: hypothetical protein VI731_02665 [Bacteroidia bacterium]|nr:hypothetical protein [Bacteroidia bacterium]
MKHIIQNILLMLAGIFAANLQAQIENPKKKTDTTARINRSAGDTTLEKGTTRRLDTVPVTPVRPEQTDSLLKRSKSRTDTIYYKIPPREGK